MRIRGTAVGAGSFDASAAVFVVSRGWTQRFCGENAAFSFSRLSVHGTRGFSRSVVDRSRAAVAGGDTADAGYLRGVDTGRVFAVDFSVGGGKTHTCCGGVLHYRRVGLARKDRWRLCVHLPESPVVCYDRLESNAISGVLRRIGEGSRLVPPLGPAETE